MVRRRESDELSKPTYEATLGAQEDIRRLLNKHIAGDSPLSDIERDRFFILFPSSTLGEGSNTLFSILIESKIYTIKSVELCARWLADQKSSKVFIPDRFGCSSSPVVSIGLFWAALLEHLYFIWPVSLSRALSMSKEDTRNKQGEGYQVS